MTRAERIEAAAMNLRAAVARSTGFSLGSAIADMDAALALPHDPVPRRLTVEDVRGCVDYFMQAAPAVHHSATEKRIAAVLNARIFGETK